MTNKLISRGITTRHLIESQIPFHIRESNPLFTKFLEYYYEFIEFDQKIVGIIQDVLTYNDIDRVELDFLISFFEEYRLLPRAIKSDPRLVAKHIYDLYQTKGSEQAVKLLFRIIWGEEASIHYPSDQILKTSDGRWKQIQIITVTDVSDEILTANQFDYRNTIVQIQKIQRIGDICRVYFYYSIDMQFVENQQITFYKDSKFVMKGKLVLTPGNISIVSSSDHWLIGQHIYLNGLSRPFICKVTNVHQIGQVKTIDILEYGDTVDLPTIVDFVSNMNQTVRVKIEHVTVAKMDCNWLTHHGLLSHNDTCLQDNFYFQLFSYVITARVMFREFYPQQKKIHPAGLKCFGNYELFVDYKLNKQIKSDIEFNEDLYLVDAPSPEDQPVFDLHIVLRGDFCVASSLREIDNYDLNNQYLYYDEEIDWDVIPDPENPGVYIKQYTKNIPIPYDKNDDPDLYNKTIDWDNIEVLELGQYTREDENIQIVITKG